MTYPTKPDTIREWLKTVPHDLLLSELGRRRSRARQNLAGGRPKILRPCPKCGQEFGARDLAHHIPYCT